MSAMSDIKKHLLNRRGFLSALAIGSAGLALSAKGQAASGSAAAPSAATPKGEPAGYRETEHVRRAYAAAKF